MHAIFSVETIFSESLLHAFDDTAPSGVYLIERGKPNGAGAARHVCSRITYSATNRTRNVATVPGMCVSPGIEKETHEGTLHNNWAARSRYQSTTKPRLRYSQGVR